MRKYLQNTLVLIGLNIVNNFWSFNFVNKVVSLPIDKFS